MVKHFEDDGEVESKWHGGGDWSVCICPEWDFSKYDYRAKPEEKQKLWFWNLLRPDGRWLMPASMYTEKAVKNTFNSSIEFEKIKALGFKYEK